MNNKKQEKVLLIINENSIFYRIKDFFKKMFNKNKTIERTTTIEESIIYRKKKITFLL